MKRLLAILLSFVMVLVLFTACGSSDTAQTSEGGSLESDSHNLAEGSKEVSANGDPYKLGVFLRFSDEAGISMRKTIEHAIEGINQSGGVNGHNLEVVYYDDEGDAAKSIDALNRLISQDEVLVALGPTTSSCALAVIDMAKEYSFPIITPQATNTTITQDYGNEWFFRNSVADIYHSHTLCDYIVEDLGAEKIAFMHETGTLGLGQYENFVERLEEKHGMQLVKEELWNEGDVDFKAQLLAIKESNPDVIVFAGHEAELAIAANQRLEVGISEDIPLCGFSSMSSADYYGVAQKAAVGSIFSTTFSPTDKRQDIIDFVAEYEPVLGSAPDHNSAQAYDTVMLLAEILKDLPLGNTAETLEADRLAIKDALAGVNGYVGLTGVTTFGPGGGPEDKDGKKTSSIYQLQPDYTWSVLKEAE